MADIAPKEWQQVLSCEIALPEGCSLEDSKEFLRSDFYFFQGSKTMVHNNDIENAVAYLAQNNFEVEDGLERIIWLRHRAGDRIRLIEVNRNGFPTGRVEAFYFAPSDDVPFKTYLADVRPEEWQQILSGEIPLPEGWSLKNSKEYLRSDFKSFQERSMRMAKNHDIEKAVEFMVKDNFEVEDGLEMIIWLRHGAGDEIRLIEVNRNGIPVGRVEAFYFAPFEQVPFEIYLADITPDEWQKVLSGEISLPNGWSLEDSREYLRSESEVENVG